MQFSNFVPKNPDCSVVNERFGKRLSLKEKTIFETATQNHFNFVLYTEEPLIGKVL